MNTPIIPLTTLCFISSISMLSAAVTSVNDPSSQWNAIDYPAGTADPLADAPGPESDEELVGNDSTPLFYTYLDEANDYMYFRTRHAADGNGGGGFGSNLFIGIEVDGNIDTIDAFVGISTQGSSDQIFIAQPSNDDNFSSINVINNSHTYTSIVDGTNYSWSDVDVINSTTNTFTGSNPDFYLSFRISFSALADEIAANTALNAGDIDASTVFQYIVVTGESDNAINKDIAGLDGKDNTYDGYTFSQLAAAGVGFSDPVSANGVALVPEPSSSMLLLIGALGLCGNRRRK